MWKIRRSNQDQIKFKQLRVLLDDLYDIVRGWRFRFASGEKVAPDGRWHCIADVSTTIRCREELGEINRNRIDNMLLAAALIDGVRLKPGQIFSLQRFVGEPAKESGFKKGPIIVRGRLGFTYGGGLCQVSTTAFIAALMANLGILQKYNHSMDIWGEDRFVDLGMDATYAFSRKDLKFENSHSTDIVLKASALEQERLFNCKIFSTQPLPGPVRVERKILKEWVPPVEPTGQCKAIKGWTVLTTRYVCQGPDEIINYRKTEKYQPSVIKKKSIG